MPSAPAHHRIKGAASRFPAEALRWKCRDASAADCGAVVAGRAHAAEPHIETAPRPFGALPEP
ncbi:hypothetical protein [Streptomyces sp. Inha503]|uniref:hypothetical protein n=1 Tax=Streptomyces sp. Inha503 TaxID=3383314 RepID=UPI0039A0E975